MTKIVIDPGHGGNDPGAIGPNGIKEKDVALAIAKKVAALLKSAGIDAQLTRDNDVFVELSARAAKANTAKANYFVSIHCNSATSSQAHGTETYCYAKGGEGEKLAAAVQKHLIQELKLTDRGVKTANYAVLRETKMPAILTEVAFISNPQEEALLRNELFQNLAAKAIAEGICEYLNIKLPSQNTAQKPTNVKEVYDMNTIVVYTGDIDALAAVVVGQKLKAPVMRQSDYQASGLKANKVIVIGTGTDRFDSFKKAAALL